MLTYLRAKDLDGGNRVSTWLGDVHTPNTDRTLATTRTTLNNSGTFIGIQIVVLSGSPNRDLYIQAKLEDYNGNLKGIIFRGYVESSRQPFGTGGLVVNQGDVLRLDSWGYVTCTIRLAGTLIRDRQIAGGWSGTSEGSTDGQGKIRTLTGTDPPAGAASNISETVPTGAKWRLMSVRFLFVTSGTAGNRAVELVYDDGTDIFTKVADAKTHPASSGYDYTAGIGLASRTGTANGDTTNLNLPDAYLSAGYKFRTALVGGKTGDNFGAPTFVVADWIEVA